MAESHVQHKLLGMAKRRIPTLIAVITLLVVWEAWVRLGHVPSTMIAAPSEIAQATVETWPTLWPATEVTLLEGTVGFLFAVTCGILIGILLYCSRIADAALFPLLGTTSTSSSPRRSTRSLEKWSNRALPNPRPHDIPHRGMI